MKGLCVLKEVKPLLEFKSEDDFYFLQIIQRKKDNPELGSNSRIIKEYYINSVDYLDNRYEEIKKLCHVFNARASLYLNKRSYRNVAFKTMTNVANSCSSEEYRFISKSYSRACGATHNDKNKKWILDLDGNKWKSEDGQNAIDGVVSYIDQLEPEGDKLYAQLSTKNGVHLITKPFNLQQFKHQLTIIANECDVHKNNPINLYTPL